MMLNLKNIYKSFGRKEVLHNISLEVEKANIYGLIGPNGAGKTTLIRIICGILPHNSGTIDYGGHTISDIAYMPDNTGLYTDMTIMEEIKYFGQLYGLSGKEAILQAEPYVQRLGLTQYLKTPVGALSKGTKRKVQFICTFLHDPYLAILDEPFSDLDPISTIEMEQIIIEKKKQGIPIFLSTHQMEQAERFCDHIFLINHGILLIDEDLFQLKLKHMKQEFLIEGLSPINFPKTHISKQHHESNGSWQWIIKIDREFTYQQLIKMLDDSEILSLRRLTPNLKDIFINVVKQS